MNYKEDENQTKPFLITDVMPFLRKIYGNRSILCVFSVIFILIFLFAVVYMILENNKTVNKILIARESTLNERLIKLENTNDILEAEVLLLQNEVKSLSKKRERKKLAKISKYLADAEITGKGLEITLKDNNLGNNFEYNETAVIHNTDLLRIVNFLWENNAQAISINDERIGPNTHISCIGVTILVNKKRITPPFKIKVIGENLSKNTVENSSIVLSLKLRGIEYKITEKDDILLLPGKYSVSKDGHG